MLGVRKFVQDTRAQALLEFALVMPILLALFIGIVEFASAWRAMHVVTHAAREGGREAIVPGSSSQQVSERINTVLSQGGLEASRAHLVLGLRDGTGTPDTVTVNYPHHFRLLGPAVRLLNPSDGEVPPGSIRLSSTTVMRNE